MLKRRMHSKVDSGKYQTCYGDDGFCISADYGRTWKKVNSTPYASIDRYDAVISSNGRYQFFSGNKSVVSSDYGNSWKEGITLGNASGAQVSADGKYMATLVGGTLYTSSDYGMTWGG